MIMCGKLIFYEYNSENMDTTTDLSKFHIFTQISMTQIVPEPVIGLIK